MRNQKSTILIVINLFLLSLLPFGCNGEVDSYITNNKGLEKMNKQEFRLEALCDFPDDAEHAPVPIRPEHIDSLMRLLKQMGVTRIGWGYYADERGGHILPYDKTATQLPLSKYKKIAETYKLLGNPLREAVKAGHKHGIEVYGYFKPYETGPGVFFPDGSPEAKKFGKIQKISGKLAWFDPFVLEHPELRIKRRMDDIPADNATRPIATIKLFKKDDSPTRISKEHLQIWASSDNYQYKPLDITFEVQESVEMAGHDIINMLGNVYHNYSTLLTRKGDKIRTLTISGLHLTEPYILVTTDFKEGKSDFHNTAIEMMRVYDEQGKEIIGVFCNGSSIYNTQLVDFRNWGLMFDHGYGCMPGNLDENNDSGSAGIIAFARGRSSYLDGALCETEPKVQQFWLECIKAILATGVDGIDFRVENHSTHTDFPKDYGYNQVVLDQLSDPNNPTVEEIARVRGNAYTEFLRKARKLINDQGKKMRINLQMDYLRAEPPVSRLLAYPANMEMQWKKWVDEGLMDEAVFRFCNFTFDQILNDSYARDIVAYCNQHNVPMVFNRYVTHGDLVEEVKRIRRDRRFCGFIFYETCCFVEYKPDGTCVIKKMNFEVPKAAEAVLETIQ